MTIKEKKVAILEEAAKVLTTRTIKEEEKEMVSTIMKKVEEGVALNATESAFVTKVKKRKVVEAKAEEGTIMIMDLEQYNRELKNHDWFYHFSDSAQVWKKGEENEKRLRLISTESPEHFALWNQFVEERRVATQGEKVEEVEAKVDIEEKVAETQVNETVIEITIRGFKEAAQDLKQGYDNIKPKAKGFWGGMKDTVNKPAQKKDIVIGVVVTVVLGAIGL